MVEVLPSPTVRFLVFSEEVQQLLCLLGSRVVFFVLIVHICTSCCALLREREREREGGREGRREGGREGGRREREGMHLSVCMHKIEEKCMKLSLMPRLKIWA